MCNINLSYCSLSLLLFILLLMGSETRLFFYLPIFYWFWSCHISLLSFFYRFYNIFLMLPGRTGFLHLLTLVAQLSTFSSPFHLFWSVAKLLHGAFPKAKGYVLCWNLGPGHEPFLGQDCYWVTKWEVACLYFGLCPQLVVVDPCTCLLSMLLVCCTSNCKYCW